MSRSSIEWLVRPGTVAETWNPTTGCNKVDRGCKNCYAEIMHGRLMFMQPEKYNKPFLDGAVMHHDLLNLPYSWKKPRTVFVNSMSDLFHKNVDWNFIYKVFEVIYHCPQHTFIILTKREDRLIELKEIYFHLQRNYPGIKVPLPNAWLLVSINDQQSADKRIRYVLDPNVPIAVRGSSCEPMTGPVDVSKYLKAVQENGFQDYGGPFGGRHALDWVICGGESGNKADPLHPFWVRSLRDQCAAAGTPFFFKQWGEYYTKWINLTNDQPTFKMYDSYLQFTQKLWVSKGDKLVDLNGKICKTGGDMQEAKYPVAIMQKVGKHNSGHLLDGHAHHRFPKQSIIHEPSITT